MNRFWLLVGLSVVGCATDARIAPIDGVAKPATPDSVVPGDEPGVDDPTNEPEPEPFVSEVRELDDLEREVLPEALRNSGALDALGAIGPFAVQEIDEAATLQVTTSLPMPVAAVPPAPYEGAGIQIDVDITGPGPLQADFEVTGLVVWRGLDVKNRSVDEAIVILAPGIVDVGSIPIADPNHDPADGSAAMYIDNPRGLYVSTAGTFDITNVALGKAQPCHGAAGMFIDCEVVDGDIEGDFDIDGEDRSGAAINVAGTYDVPAYRLTLTDAP